MRTSFALTLLAGASLWAVSAPAVANDWEGFSVGVGGGYGMANTRINESVTEDDETVGGTLRGFPSAGGFLTLSAGYDHALAGTLIVGTFVDYDFSDIGSKSSFAMGDQLSAGGRVGYLVAPTTLFFSTFGYAHADSPDNGNGARLPIANKSFNGYFAGGGVETLIGGGFSLKAEYRYSSFRSQEQTYEDDGETATLSARPTVQSARLSLNYRFGNGKTEPVDNSIPPVTSSWTSPYIGVGVGAVSADTEVGDAEAFNTNHLGSDGKFLSFTAGYDYQFDSRLVAGIFGDADYARIRFGSTAHESDEDGNERIRFGNSFDNLFMVGGRLGYLTTPDTLLFVSGGYANAGLSDGRANVQPEGKPAELTTINGKRFNGGFIGGGVETRINDALSLKAEYRYVDFGRQNLSVDAPDDPEAPASVSFDPSMQLGMISLNWRFNGSLTK